MLLVQNTLNISVLFFLIFDFYATCLHADSLFLEYFGKKRDNYCKKEGFYFYSMIAHKGCVI